MASRTTNGNDSADQAQREDERRKLRSTYRKLINDLQAGEDENNDNNDETVHNDEEGPCKLKDQLEVVDRLYPKVNHTREAALDCHVYSLIASNAKQRVQNLQTNLVLFDPEEYAEKLKTYFDVDRSEYPDSIPNKTWSDMGKAMSLLFKRTPTYHFLAGTFEPGEVQPRVSQKKPRNKKTDDSSQKATIVEKIVHNEKDYEEKTSEEVETVYIQLHKLYMAHKEQPLCYFRFVIDPSSFPRTVENIFHTSFLVKDGHCEVFYDQFSLPVIKPMDKNQNVAHGAHGKVKFAVALGISVPEWKEIIKQFEIKKAAIPWKKK